MALEINDLKERSPAFLPGFIVTHPQNHNIEGSCGCVMVMSLKLM